MSDNLAARAGQEEVCDPRADSYQSGSYGDHEGGGAQWPRRTSPTLRTGEPDARPDLAVIL